MKELKRSDVDKAFNSFDYSDVKMYQDIIEMFEAPVASKDKKFQKLFNKFYKVRFYDKEYYKKFYSYMEECKEKNNIQFKEILENLYKITRRVEMSFGSKLFATINPNKPILDIHILKALEETIPYTNNYEERILRVANFYEKLCGWYKDLKANHKDLVCYITKKFDEHYPNSKMTETKKIDYVLWWLGKYY